MLPTVSEYTSHKYQKENSIGDIEGMICSVDLSAFGLQNSRSQPETYQPRVEPAAWLKHAEK